MSASMRDAGGRRAMQGYVMHVRIGLLHARREWGPPHSPESQKANSDSSEVRLKAVSA